MTERPVFGVTPPPPVGAERYEAGWHPVCGHVHHSVIGPGQIALAPVPGYVYGLLTLAEIEERRTVCDACRPPSRDQIALDLL